VKPILVRELSRLGREPEELFVYANGDVEWGVRLAIAGRRFAAGCAFRDGFFCREETARGERPLVAPEAGPIFGAPDHLARNAVALIHVTLDNPERGGAEPPVI
jgi:hypothetical protein